MDHAKPVRLAARALTDSLCKHGWDDPRPSAGNRHDLCLATGFEGHEATLRIMSTSGGHDDANLFVRVELGRLVGPVENWELGRVMVDRTDGSGERAWMHEEVSQSVLGRTWACVGLGFDHLPNEDAWEGVANRLLARVEGLSPARDKEERRASLKQARAAAEQYAKRARRETRRLVVWLVIFFLFPAGAAILGRANGDGSLLSAGVLGMVAVVGMGLAFYALERRRHAARGPRWDAPLQVLRDSGVFESLNLVSRTSNLDVPALCARPEGTVSCTAKLIQEQFEARSARHGLRSRIEVNHLPWPEGTLEACRIAPAGYVVLWLSGDGLTRLPAGPRERRHDDHITWVLTDTEFEDGSAGRALEKLANAIGVRRTLPYR